MVKWNKALNFQQGNRKKFLSQMKKFPSHQDKKNKKRKREMCHLNLRRRRVKKKIILKKILNLKRILKKSSLKNMGMKKKRILKGKTTPRSTCPLSLPSNALCSSRTSTKKKTQGWTKRLPRIKKLKSRRMKKRVIKNNPRKSIKCPSGWKIKYGRKLLLPGIQNPS